MKTEIQIGADIREFNSKMKQVQKTVMGIGETARSVTSSLIATTAKIAKVTTGLGVAGGGATFLASEKSFRKFENTMMQAFTLLPNANKQAFAKMKKDALEFSETYGISTNEVAAGLYQSLSAGISPERVFSFMRTAQESAIAGATDLRTSVDAFTNIMNAYGQDKYDTEYLADALFKGITMSKLTFEELSRYMYQAIPVAASLKVNIVDLVGAISALSATGTLTRVGATQFRQMLVELQDHGSTANTIFRQMAGGVSFQQFVAEGGRLTEILAILRKGAKAVQLDMGNLFSSIEAGNAARQLDTFERFPSMIKELDENLFGSKNQAHEKMASALEMGNKIMKNSFFNFFTRLGDVFSPAFETFYDFTTELSRSLREDIDWQGMSESFERSWKVAMNIAEQGTDKLVDYLKTHLKIALLNVYSQFVKIFDKATTFLAQLFGLDGAEFTSFLDSLFVVAKSFAKSMVDELRSALPAMITALAPLFSFISASIQSAIDNLNPFDRGEDTKATRARKAQEYDGSELETFSKAFQEREEVEQGLQKFAQSEEQREKFRTRQNYQSDMLEVDTSGNIFKIGDEALRDFADSTLGGLIGDRYLPDDAKLKYKGNFSNMLETLQDDMARDEELFNKQLPNLGDVELTLGSLSELLKSAISIKFPDMDIDDALTKALPKEAIDFNFGEDDVDLSKVFDKDTFNPQSFLVILKRLQDLMAMPDEALIPILQDATNMPEAQATKNIDSVRSRLNSTIGRFGGFIQEVLATYHDAQVGLGKVQDIDPSEISFDERYNETMDTIKRNVAKMQKYEEQHAKNRDIARKAEKTAALEELTADAKSIYDKMGKIDISKISADSPVLDDIEQKIKANQAKVDAYNREYGANIELEDPAKAVFGAFDLEKTQSAPDYDIRPLFREVVSDSKQKIGAGGGTFNFASVQERLLSSQKILAETNKQVAEKTKELTEIIKENTKVTPKDVKAPEIKTETKQIEKEKKEFSIMEVIKNTFTKQKEKETEKESFETIVEKYKEPNKETKKESKPVQNVIQEILTPKTMGIEKFFNKPIEEVPKQEPTVKEFFDKPIEQDNTKQPSVGDFFSKPVQEEKQPSVGEFFSNPIQEEKELSVGDFFSKPLEKEEEKELSVGDFFAKPIQEQTEREPSVGDFFKNITPRFDTSELDIANKRTAIQSNNSDTQELSNLVQSLNRAGLKIEHASNIMKIVLEENKSKIEDVYPITF